MIGRIHKDFMILYGLIEIFADFFQVELYYICHQANSNKTSL